MAELPHWARLLYGGLWTIADKAGRLEDRPKRIKAEIFPYEKIDIEKGLTMLATVKNGSKRPFIARYEIEDESFIQIVNWHKHQKPHHTEKESVIPLLPHTYIYTNTKYVDIDNQSKDKDKDKDKGKCSPSKCDVKQPILNGEITVNKAKYLDYVLLSDDEYQKLKEKLGKELDSYIERLNHYIGSKGKKYKSHYHTIIAWSIRKDSESGVVSKKEFSDGTKVKLIEMD